MSFDFIQGSIMDKFEIFEKCHDSISADIENLSQKLQIEHFMLDEAFLTVFEQKEIFWTQILFPQ